MEPNVSDTAEKLPAEQVDETPSVLQDGGPRQVLDALSDLATDLSSLKRTVEDRLSYDKAKEEAFDRLYADLENLKKNAAFEQIRPLYMDLILLFDRIALQRRLTCPCACPHAYGMIAGPFASSATSPAAVRATSLTSSSDGSPIVR